MDTVICLTGSRSVHIKKVLCDLHECHQICTGQIILTLCRRFAKGCFFLKAFQDQTFETQESDRVVGAVSTGTLLLIEAPEAHVGVCMDLLSCVAGWNPNSGSSFDGPGLLTHPVTVVKANGVQLLVVSTAAGVIDVEPCGPLESICVSEEGEGNSHQ